MDYPVVETETKDGLPLHGILLKAENSKTAVIFIHGTASNFFENEFIKPVSNSMIKNNISVLAVNNRGSEVLKAYPPQGSALEYFEDCLKDIDAWIEFAQSKGYKEIILMGHSLGTEKAVYYMNKGKHRNKVKAVIMLAFSDSYGSQIRYLKDKDLMPEAKNLVKKGKSYQFLTSDWNSHAGTLPTSAKTYVNFYNKNSALSKNFPIHEAKNLISYRNIKVPILAVIGDKDKWRFMDTNKAKKLLEKENSRTEFHSITNCNHDFEGKEEQLASIVGSFVRRLR